MDEFRSIIATMLRRLDSVDVLVDSGDLRGAYRHLYDTWSVLSALEDEMLTFRADDPFTEVAARYGASQARIHCFILSDDGLHLAETNLAETNLARAAGGVRDGAAGFWSMRGRLCETQIHDVVIWILHHGCVSETDRLRLLQGRGGVFGLNLTDETLVAGPRWVRDTIATFGEHDHEAGWCGEHVAVDDPRVSAYLRDLWQRGVRPLERTYEIARTLASNDRDGRRGRARQDTGAGASSDVSVLDVSVLDVSVLDVSVLDVSVLDETDPA